MAHAQSGATVAARPAATAFAWDDPFLLEEQLTGEKRLIRETAPACPQEKLLPRIIAAYRDEKTDSAIFREMGELDWACSV